MRRCTNLEQLREVSENFPTLESESISHRKYRINIMDNMKKKAIEDRQVSLSLPELGVKKRGIIVKLLRGGNTLMVNPVVTFKFMPRFSTERCRSVDSKLHYTGIKRWLFIRVKYLNEELEVVSKNLGYKDAVKVLHAIDHLNGILICDIGKEATFTKKLREVWR